jgi:hypothetical protein
MGGFLKAAEEGRSGVTDDWDVAEARAVPHPLVPPEEAAALIVTLAMLRSLVYSTVEARLMQSRFALRRWHLRGDLKSIKGFSERLMASAVAEKQADAEPDP